MPTLSSWMPQSPRLGLPLVKSSLSGYSSLTWRCARTHNSSYHFTAQGILSMRTWHMQSGCLFPLALRPSGTSEVYYHPKKGARIQTTRWAWCLACANSQNMPRNCLEEAWADCPGTNHSRDCSNNLTV